MTSKREQLRQRTMEASQHLYEVLRLSSEGTDSKLLQLAITEMVVQESQHNPQFAHEIRRHYNDLATFQTAAANGKAEKAPPLPPLIPLNTNLGYHEVDPFTPPDPAYLVRVYGHDQLARALHDYKLATLKLTMANVQRSHPGTKPTNLGNKASVIDYIVKYT